MKKERRWLKSVIAASLDPQVALPWQRGQRRRPAGLTASPKASAVPQAKQAMAAR